MAKKTKNVGAKTGKQPASAQNQNADVKKTDKLNQRSYLWNMSYAPTIDESIHWFQMLPIAFFSAFVIIITRMHSYQRDMSQFYWSGGNSELTDFFSYFKMIAIIVCAVLALVLILYRLFTQSFAIKRCFAYIPMAIYSVFVIISYLCSDYKDFALLGYNDRFEGTLSLLAYMVMLFFIINSINSERNVKWVVYPIAVSSAILGVLGVSQALDHDFFRTVIGQKLITPNFMTESGSTVHELIEQAAAQGEKFLNFTFVNKEIYQTVYNINYVSFYLTLLLPLFGMLFIHSMMKGKEEKIWKKVIWGALFGLLVYNLIGSASSGGFLGMAIVVLVAIIILNKRILKWWKPLAILIVLTVLMGGVTYDRWLPELTGAISGVTGSNVSDTTESESETAVKHNLEYIDTDGNNIIMGIDGSTFTFTTYPDNPIAIKIVDQDDKSIDLVPTDVSPVYGFDDERLGNCFLQPAQDEQGNNYFLFTSDGQKQNWPFRITNDGVFYLNGLGALVDLDKIPAIGWENNGSWGNGRGYIFSRTLPMMKDTMLIGNGADTYCIYFPQKDYVGKYNSVSFTENMNIIVDKPHNMYMGAWTGTGGLSVISLLAMWGIYIVQSAGIYFKRKFESFNEFIGCGIFLGICGFLAAALVDDSTVSVMPMFYGLLGTGIAINMILKRDMPLKEKKAVDKATE